MNKKKAHAKLNLNLHISPQINIRGYHPVHFINTQLDLHDELFFEPALKNINVICDNSDMPPQEENLVYKAALLLKKLDPKNQGVKITIKKNIPVKAGLGGGSADAAVTLKALSDLWDIKLTTNQLINLADSLGKDVVYSLTGNLAEVGGYGDKITPLNYNVPSFWLVIIVPELSKPSTSWMYAHIDNKKVGKHITFLDKIKEALNSGSKKDFLNNLHNDFDEAVYKYFPVTKTIKKELEDSGSSAVLLCGSGLTMAGFFENKDKAEIIRDILIDKYKNVYVTKLI